MFFGHRESTDGRPPAVSAAYKSVLDVDAYIYGCTYLFTASHTLDLNCRVVSALGIFIPFAFLGLVAGMSPCMNRVCFICHIVCDVC